MKCRYCDYEWEPRRAQPKSCPRCKRRFDYPDRKASEDPLSDAGEIERGFERTIYVMSVITPKLEGMGVKCVIVGGSAVEFYTRDWYATGDIDLAITREKRNELTKVLDTLGFANEGRMWVREDLNLYVEAPGDIRDLDLKKATRVETKVGHAYIIGIEDIILDRIQAAEHWQSESDREQAVRMAAILFDEIDWKYLREKCKKAKTEKMLDAVLEAVEDAKNEAE